MYITQVSVFIGATLLVSMGLGTVVRHIDMLFGRVYVGLKILSTTLI